MTRHTERKVVEALCGWFARQARDLPWRQRRHRTGYGALVAEAMLQQTQVARVALRYPAFMQRFPSVRVLAGASEQEVLELWQGMGYYRRARHLHRAAQEIVAKHGGRVPSDAATLRQLPGVGRYTAGAIASIVFGKREPIVDGNVERVLARLYAQRHANGEAKSWTWDTAERLVKLAQRPGVFNEALMELGATVCTPRSPRCDECPLSSMCRAHKQGAQDRFPGIRGRAKPQAWVHHAIVVRRASQDLVLLEQRPSNGMWAGMWQVPTIESANELAVASLQSRLGFAVRTLSRCGSFEHHTTHRAIAFHVYTATARIKRGLWLTRTSDALARLPMSAAQRRVLALADV